MSTLEHELESLYQSDTDSALTLFNWH